MSSMAPNPNSHTTYKPSVVPWLGDVPERRRRSIRLLGFDYRQPGVYFITVCTRDRSCLLGNVVEGRMRLSEAGRLAQDVWDGLPSHYPHVRMDAFIIMPNHVHGIVFLVGAGLNVRAGLKPAPTGANMGADTVRHGLPEVVRAFKTFSARRMNALLGAVGGPFWQRNYYEHVIRNEAALNRIRQYIVDNPARWHEDPENPALRAGQP